MSIKIKESDPAYTAFFLTKMAVPNLCSTIIMWMVILSNNNAPHAFSIMHHMLANMKAVAARPAAGLIARFRAPSKLHFGITKLNFLSCLVGRGSALPNQVALFSKTTDRYGASCLCRVSQEGVARRSQRKSHLCQYEQPCKQAHVLCVHPPRRTA